MSKHYTRKKLVTDSCSSCNEKISKNEKPFDCAISGNRMRLSEQSTELSDVALRESSHLEKMFFYYAINVLEEKATKQSCKMLMRTKKTRGNKCKISKWK